MFSKAYHLRLYPFRYRHGALNRTVLSAPTHTYAYRSFDHTVKLWDVRTGRCVHTLAGHHGEISSTQFNYASDLCISGSIDRTCKLWDVGSLMNNIFLSLEHSPSPTLFFVNMQHFITRVTRRSLSTCSSADRPAASDDAESTAAPPRALCTVARGG